MVSASEDVMVEMEARFPGGFRGCNGLGNNASSDGGPDRALASAFSSETFEPRSSGGLVDGSLGGNICEGSAGNGLLEYALGPESATMRIVGGWDR